MEYGLRGAYRKMYSNQCILVTGRDEDEKCTKRIKLIWNLKIYDFHNPFDRTAHKTFFFYSDEDDDDDDGNDDDGLSLQNTLLISLPFSLSNHFNLIHFIPLSFGWLERNLFEIKFGHLGCLALIHLFYSFDEKRKKLHSHSTDEKKKNRFEWN